MTAKSELGRPPRSSSPIVLWKTRPHNLIRLARVRKSRKAARHVRPSWGDGNSRLASSLLFVLIVAMGLSLFVTGRRFKQAETELAEYRREYGILKIADNPTKLQAIALWTGEPNHWRWRVYFPPGRYDLCYLTTGIPENGLPKPKGGSNADFSGLVDVSVTAFKDPKDGVWRYAIANKGSQGGNETYVDLSVIPDDEGMSESNGSVNRDNVPVIVSTNEPLVLLRKRVVKMGETEMSSIESLRRSDVMDQTHGRLARRSFNQSMVRMNVRASRHPARKKARHRPLTPGPSPACGRGETAGYSCGASSGFLFHDVPEAPSIS